MTTEERKTSVCGSSGHRNSFKEKGIGVLHRIPEVKITDMEIKDEYNIEKTIAEGCFAKIFLCHHRPTSQTVVLKAIHVELTTPKEFIKEFHYSYQLSHHPNILSSYQVAFKTKEYFLFAQEYAPFGDLAANLIPGGLPEMFCKAIASQLSSALGFMHSKSLVHRDLKLENVLVFAKDFSRVKLCDFGATTREGTLVNKISHTWISFLPPEILEVVKNERFICKSSSDSWQFGILIFYCLTGNPPWESADWVRDSSYATFMKYQKRKTTKIPENFRKFTPRLIRAFRKIFNHEEDKRAKITEIMKYIKDKWLDPKISTSKSATSILAHINNSDQDSIRINVRRQQNRHSFDETKFKHHRLTSNFGIETLLDNETIKNRICEWVLSCEETYDDNNEISSLRICETNEQTIKV